MANTSKNTSSNAYSNKTVTSILNRVSELSTSLENLNKLVTAYADLTEKQLNNVGTSLNDIRQDIEKVETKLGEVDKVVRLQNSRVYKLEEGVKNIKEKETETIDKVNNVKKALYHRIENCPGAALIRDITTYEKNLEKYNKDLEDHKKEDSKYKKDMSPVYVISTTNWKFVIILIVITAFLVQAFPTIYKYVVSELWDKFEINPLFILLSIHLW